MTAHRRNLLWLAAFLVVSLSLTWTILVTLRRDVQGPTHSYTAMFTDASGLRKGSDVRIAGVRVGRVDAVELDGTRARVRFRVQRDQPVYGDTRASIVYQNIAGQRYLGLTLADFGQPARLPDGATIPVEHTEPSFDLTGLLNGFEPLFTLLDPADRGNLSTALIEALQGDVHALTTLITETSRLAQVVAGPDELLGKVITSLNGVVATLAAQGTRLQTTLTQVRTVVDGLAEQRGELVSSLGAISGTVGRLAAVIAGVAPDLEQLLAREPGWLATIVGNPDGVATLGANLPAVFKGLARVTGDSTAMSAQACDFNFTILDLIAPVVPAIVDSATPGGQRRYSAQCR
ncbi:MCE family protein [Nocardia otitidiscaviarum]|uniref:MCE family protein n=1 Tax=Nocardia otitidiscaviarum TaxID=1823 RepID=A0A516NLY9_9NOCA|nr:MlaD family protein [Nocardia otitidiscaviarum]MCP9624934.1 MCE family protein [Nocardia otitidiscaviarum]QDP79933.1 MCE family protein [Nocardia otitidiscaviarum]